MANAGPAATAAIALHASLMATIKSRTTRVVDYVSSNEAWGQFLPGVKQAANKVRNYSPSANKKETPAGAGEPPAKPKTKTGQQSYGNIDHWFEKLIEAVKLVPNYKPGTGSNIELPIRPRQRRVCGGEGDCIVNHGRAKWCAPLALLPSGKRLPLTQCVCVLQPRNRASQTRPQLELVGLTATLLSPARGQ